MILAIATFFIGVIFGFICCALWAGRRQCEDFYDIDIKKEKQIINFLNERGQ